MSSIKIMISSTVSNLLSEREAAVEAFTSYPFVELIGAHPLNNTSRASSSNIATREFARDCDLYILILGEIYGFETPSGKSATEIEFEEAFKDNPTKVLVFLKETNNEVEARQQEFINRVSDYSKGYWRTSFEDTQQLKEYIDVSFINWLKERAAIGSHLNYVDHFLRTAIQRKPEAMTQVFYKTFENHIELNYILFGKTHKLHFQRKEILNNFWGCLAELEVSFNKWLSDEDN